MHEKWSESVNCSSCLTLCDPVNSSLPGSSVHGILLARILQWVAIPFCRGSSGPRDQIGVSHIAEGFFTVEPPEKPLLGACCFTDVSNSYFGRK